MKRERIDPADRLSTVLSMKVTVAEKAAWLEKAEASCMTSSALFRATMLEGEVNVVPRPRTDTGAVSLLHLYFRVTLAVEGMLNPATLAAQRGVLSRSEYLTLLVRLDQVVQLYQVRLRNDH